MSAARAWRVTGIGRHHYLGTYRADTATEALEAFARDAGFASFEASCSALGFRAVAACVEAA